jgi:serine/threonine protein kinase
VFLLRQFVEGESLARYAEQGKLAALDRDPIARDLCDAVRALASRGVVHGGLHPGNVIIQPEGRVKVTDFGIHAAVLLRDAPRSCPLDPLAYLAHEQWRGAEATAQTNIYSIAAIIHLVDRGLPAFRGSDWTRLKQAILAGRSNACPVLAAALHPEPERRYPRIEEFGCRLADRNVGTDAPPSPPPPPPAGTLAWIFDVKEQRNLLETTSPKPWKVARDGRRQQRPLQVSNSGSGNLELSVSCTGAGLSASPSQLTVSPGQMGAVIVRLEPDSTEFANLIFRWNERDGEKMVVVKIIRRK